MSDARGSVWITFNGEIFNHVELRRKLIALGRRFRTRSDTEVVLEAYGQWGLNCLDEFNGDFAFAIWDKTRERMILARDRMGVRPLYYAVKNGTMIFGSEVKALLEVPGVEAELDPVALCQCLTLWFPLAPRTAFKGILQLQPGHVLIAERGSITTRAYWKLDYPWEDGPRILADPEDDLVEQLRNLLLDSTRIRLRSDVPVGAYLSGGVDSSAVTALMKQLAPGQLRTFSVAFESQEFDESQFQQQVARAIGCEHSCITMRTEDIGTVFPEVIRHIEQPTLRTAPAPLFQLAGFARQSGFKVVLTGEGADEVLAGYDLFKEAKIRRFWSRQPSSSWRFRLLRRLYPYLPGLQGQSSAFLGSFFKVGLDQPDDPLFSHLPRWSTTRGILRFLSDDLGAALSSYDPIDDLRSSLPTQFSAWHPLCRAQYLETAHLLPGYILSCQGDRVAMASAVEGRFPFLDPRLVDFGAALPPRLKLRGLTEKYLFRRAVEPLLPRPIANRPKQPYRAPEAQSFFGSATPDYVEQLLSAGEISDAGYFDPGAVTKLVQKCRPGTALSLRDNMSLVGILSVQLLDHLFVSGTRKSPLKDSTFASDDRNEECFDDV